MVYILLVHLVVQLAVGRFQHQAHAFVGYLVLPGPDRIQIGPHRPFDLLEDGQGVRSGEKLRSLDPNHQLMKNLILRGEWKNKRMKAIRYWIINIPARIIKYSRELIIQLRRGHPSFRLIKDARARIMEIGCVPAG